MIKTRISSKLQAELAVLAAMPDDQIDTADIPEAPPENWDRATRAHYRPVKKSVTLRLDMDVIAWFKAHAQQRGYQTEINRVLRQYAAEAAKQEERAARP